MIERKRVEIEGGIKDGSWRFRRREMTFQEKQKKTEQEATISAENNLKTAIETE